MNEPQGDLRVVVDTNVWVSAFLNPQGAPAQVFQALVDKRFTPVIAPALLAEISAVIHRPRIRRHCPFSEQEIATALTVLEDQGFMVVPAGDLRLCRDPKDNFLLEMATLAKAQLAVTRDDDLKRDRAIAKPISRHLEQRRGCSPSPGVTRVFSARC